MKKIFCICTTLIFTAFVVTTSVVSPSNAQTMEEPFDEPWRLPRQTDGFSADAAENVELVGITPGACYAVAVDGNTAYIGAGVYLLILDITDKSAPALLGSVQLPDIVYGIAVSDGYAYIAAYYSGLRVVDVSNPASPDEVGFYDTPGYARDVAVSGGLAYIADGGSGGLRVVDVSNPEKPDEVGFYDTPGWAYGVAVSGGLAYIADGSRGLRIVDISNPENPYEVGFYDTPGDARKVAVSGGLAYIADYDRGLRVIDVSNPENPYEVGFYQTFGFAGGVAVSGGLAYIADGSGLRVVDVSNPENPYEVGFYNTPGYAQDVAVSGGYAYVAARYSGFRVVDVSNPENPYEVGFYDTPRDAYGVAISGGLAYIANGYGGLRIVDVSNPENPYEVGFYDTPGDAYGVAVSGGFAYIADSASGLRVVDVSNPENPYEVGFYDTPGYAQDVAVSGGFAYIADSASGLHIVDVSNPENPYGVGFYDTPGYARDVAVSGGFAYIADSASGFHIVDISNPENPYEVGFYDTAGNGVAISGGYAYIADGGSGLWVIDVSNPEKPNEVGVYDTPGYAYGVAVANGLIYVADGDGGMSILRFTAAELSVSSISPSSGPAAGGTWVMIYGTNFKKCATVTIGGNDAINPVVDPVAAMFITAVTPPGVGGPADVVVTNPDDESATLEGGFMYIPTGDVSANGTVSAYDAALILQYVVGLITEFPVDRLTSPSDVTPQDYELRLPNLTAKAGERIYVPLQLGRSLALSSAGALPSLDEVSGLFAGGVTIKYDANLLRAVNVRPSLSGVYHESNISRPGEIRFAFATAKPVNSAGELLMVEFYIMPNTEGKISPLLISDAQLSESLSIAKYNGLVEVLPAKTALLPNYPNPFNPETWIPYQLSAASDVTVDIYDVHGRLVRVFDLGMQPGGSYVTKDSAVYWNGKNEAGERVASGVYFYRLKAENPEAGAFSAIRRLIVVK